MNNHINKELSGSKDKNKNENFKLNSKQIEQARKEKFDKQLAKSVKFFLIGLAGIFVSQNLPGYLEQTAHISANLSFALENFLTLGAYTFGGLGLAKFSGLLREPLDAEQAKEIKKEDEEEMERLKGGTRHR